LKNRYFKEIHVVFQVKHADICKHYGGTLLKVVISIGFLSTYMFGYEHFSDLHSQGKIVKLLHGYHSSLNSKICHYSKNMK